MNDAYHVKKTFIVKIDEILWLREWRRHIDNQLKIIQRMKTKNELSTTSMILRKLRRIFVQFMLFFYEWLFLLEHCISFAFEQHHSFHTNDYKRTIKFAFEYSFQRRARNSRSNYTSFNIVYARNVNVRMTKIAFANDLHQIIDFRRYKFYHYHVNVEIVASNNI